MSKTKWTWLPGSGHETKWWPAIYLCHWSGGEWGGIGLRLGRWKSWTLVRTPVVLKRPNQDLVNALNLQWRGQYIHTEDDTIAPDGGDGPPVLGIPFGGDGWCVGFFEREGRVWVAVDYGYTWVIKGTTRVEAGKPVGTLDEDAMEWGAKLIRGEA